MGNTKNKKYEMAWWIFGTVTIYLIFILSSDGLFLAIVAGVAGILCGYKCAEWAIIAKKNPNIAFLIGFLFILIGLLGYYLYSHQDKKVKK